MPSQLRDSSLSLTLSGTTAVLPHRPTSHLRCSFHVVYMTRFDDTLQPLRRPPIKQTSSALFPSFLSPVQSFSNEAALYRMPTSRFPLKEMPTAPRPIFWPSSYQRRTTSMQRYRHRLLHHQTYHPLALLVSHHLDKLTSPAFSLFSASSSDTKPTTSTVTVFVSSAPALPNLS